MHIDVVARWVADDRALGVRELGQPRREFLAREGVDANDDLRSVEAPIGAPAGGAPAEKTPPTMSQYLGTPM